MECWWWIEDSQTKSLSPHSQTQTLRRGLGKSEGLGLSAIRLSRAQGLVLIPLWPLSTSLHFCRLRLGELPTLQSIVTLNTGLLWVTLLKKTDDLMILLFFMQHFSFTNWIFLNHYYLTFNLLTDSPLNSLSTLNNKKLISFWNIM